MSLAKLLTELCHCAKESLGMFFGTGLDVSDHRPRRVPSKTWRELIKKACAREGG
jgi:hypothetical protein